MGKRATMGKRSTMGECTAIGRTSPVLDTADRVTWTHVLGYDSAIEVFRRAGRRLVGRPHEHVSLRDVGATSRAFTETSIFQWLGVMPVHVVVASPADKRTSSSVVSHVWGAGFDEWPVVRLTDGVCVSSPEFVFLQMANVLDEMELIFLGCELCGTYEFVAGRVVRRGQLATVASIRAFLEEVPHAHGRARALRALKRVLDGSGSPMETELALRLCLPARYGGRGIAVPQLNGALVLSGPVRAALGYEEITPDVHWPGTGLVLEYDSDEEHTGANRIACDARRRLAYDGMGLHAITVTKEMLNSREGFEVLVREVAKATGKRLRSAGREELVRRERLHRQLHHLATHPESLLWAAHQS